MEHNKINILYLIDTYRNGGGTESHLADVTTYLNRDKFNYIMCSFDLQECPFVARIRSGGTPIEYIPLTKIYLPSAFSRARKLIKLIKDHQIDIVQTFHFKSDTFGVLVSKLAGVRTIISSRRDLGDLKKRRHLFLNKAINPLIDHFIVVCNSVRNVMRNVEGVPEDKMTTVYNGVQLRRFQPCTSSVPIAIKRELEIPDNAFVVGSIAYLRPEKAYHIFFQAMEEIQHFIKPWCALIVGDGPLKESLQILCKKMGIDRNVRFVGSVVDVPQYISLMDLLCLVPNKNEGFSNAILEAMAMQKPVIATDVGGNAEAVEDGQTGILIPPNDSKRLVEAILKLYTDIDLRTQMGDKGRRRIENNFSLQHMIMSMEDLYSQIYLEANG